jgi:hypothetical protein
MTIDHELLELAAKAAGCLCYRRNDQGNFEIKSHPLDPWSSWNPLTEDGDALRLAVFLKLDVMGSLSITKFRYVAHGQNTYAAVGEDPYATTRRAIVLAAAAIGRVMG